MYIHTVERSMYMYIQYIHLAGGSELIDPVHTDGVEESRFRETIVRTG